MKQEVLMVSRQDTIAELTPWFDQQLENLIENRTILSFPDLEKVREGIVLDLASYRVQTGINKVVLGMSGGVDSALTAALFKEADWEVTGFLLPINQNPVETARGQEACEQLDIPFITVDLSHEANSLANRLVSINPTTKAELIRAGNIRARLRMITLYNAAASQGGLVASTDNFSELSAGFWTLHGDVGDLSPIQSLWKSWEVPMLARMCNVPKSIYTAKPTDGLGVDNGDEAQFGCSYLEWDLMLMSILNKSLGDISSEKRATEVYNSVVTRLSSTTYKRFNPAYLKNKVDPGRFDQLAGLDAEWVPNILK